MLKRIFLLALAIVFSLSLIACGENNEDVYSFYDAASQKEVSSEISSETESKQEEISSAVSEGEASSETASEEYLEVEDGQLEDDKEAIEEVAKEAMTAFFKGDVDGIKKAQPLLYDAFLENEQAAAMLSSVSANVYETYGDDAETSLKVTDISAGTAESIDDMQLMVDSFECDLEVETVRNVTFEVTVKGSLGNDTTENEIPVFYANETWYIAVFSQIDMSAMENMDPSVFDDMAGDISDEMIQDMLENMPQ